MAHRTMRRCCLPPEFDECGELPTRRVSALCAAEIQVGPDVRWMSRLEAAERALGEAEQRRATMSRLEAAERALGEAEQRATTASALSASRESDRMVDELIAKHAPRGLRLHWEQQQRRAACELDVMCSGSVCDPPGRHRLFRAGGLNPHQVGRASYRC